MVGNAVIVVVTVHVNVNVVGGYAVSQRKIKSFKSLKDAFIQIIKDKKQRNKLIYDLICGFVMLSLLLVYLQYGFEPIQEHLKKYKDTWNYDQWIYLMALIGSIVPFLWIVKIQYLVFDPILRFFSIFKRKN